MHDVAQLIGPAHVAPVDPDLGHGNGRLGADDRLHPAQHLVKRARVRHHVVVGIVEAGLVQIDLGPGAMGTARLAEDVVTANLGAGDVGGDGSICLVQKCAPSYSRFLSAK